MIIACPACSTRYAVPASAIGVDGRRVRCAKCSHNWHQDGPSPEILAAEAEAVPPPAAAAPAPPPQQRQSTPHAAQEAHGASQPDSAEPVAPGRDNTPAGTAAQAPGRESVGADASSGNGSYSGGFDEGAAPPPMPTRSPSRSESPAGGRRASIRKTPVAVYDDTEGTVHYADERPSSFDFSPPFRPRRNWTKIGTYAAGIFAVVTLGVTGAIAWGGLPDWVPIAHDSYRAGTGDLQLDFPRKRQDRKPLPDGSEFFSVSGTITNIGSQSREVPSLLVVLRDERDRIVYEKEIVPARPKLGPGEALTVNEALTDIPKAAASAEIGWKPG
ncbi:zinc-ribbon domain-containing protein [Novosphingobium sp. YJ-S2-02]|uniref:Zinc-ribbon domain-containing protein n=1 Tax=Novosphingobium aureum TaxID=2792964 RepID=A0A931MJI8_9SPHN|nr:MJ0042-type zinc finger domain-containing protein [Novosphingobium aureum]MBH0111862.1 zinc-ribbon domain-containing protein [Novosphingobium aureum]